MKKMSKLISMVLLLSLTSCLPVLFTGIGTSTLMFAKDRTKEVTLSDIRLSTLIKASFIKNGFKELYSKINVEVFAGRVLLTGYLNTKSDVNTAIKLTKSQTGVVEVINELKINNNQTPFDAKQYSKDAFITTKIKSIIALDRNIKSINYNVVTTNRVVYLFGIARSEEELKKVATFSANIRGVTKVISHVAISNNNYKSRSNSSSQFIEEDYDSDDEIIIKDIDSEFSKY